MYCNCFALWVNAVAPVRVLSENMKTRNALFPGAAMLAFAAVSSDAAVYSSGHADFGVAYEGGVFDFHVHAAGATIDGVDVDDEEYEASEIVTLVPAAATVILPVDFPALGAVAGQNIWVLPEQENPVLPFLGLATEELAPAEWGDITFTLGSVVSPSGAGHFAVWQTGSFGTLLLHMSTADPGPDFFVTQAGTHSHHNYGFSEPGIWEIELTVSGTHVTDGFVSATETFQFQVVPESSVVLLGPLGLLAGMRRRR